jgi:hypothetical protein
MPPITLDVEDLNKKISEEADKQGVDIGQPKAEKTEDAEKKTEAADKNTNDTKEDVVYQQKLKVNGRDILIEGASPEEVLSKISIALEAAQPAEKKEEPKPSVTAPALSQDELFKIGQSLQQGKVEAIDEYIEKSGLLDRLLEKKGVSVSELKRTVSRTLDNEVVGNWQTATQEFNAAHPEFIGTDLNKKLIGYKIAELHLEKNPSLATLEKVYDACKADGFLQTEAPAKKEAEGEKKEEKKKAAGSSVFGSGQTGAQRARGAESTGKLETELEKLKNKLEKNEITTSEYISAYNGLIADAGPA